MTTKEDFTNAFHGIVIMSTLYAIFKVLDLSGLVE